MKLLVAGASGQLARELVERSRLLAGVTVTALGRPQLDLLDRASIARAIEATRPDLVINAAAYTAVDKAESEPELAHAVNAAAPAVLQRFAQLSLGPLHPQP